MGSKRAKAMCAAMRKTAKVSADADRRGQVLALEPQQPDPRPGRSAEPRRPAPPAAAARQTKGRSDRRRGTWKACNRPRRDAPAGCRCRRQTAGCATPTGPSPEPRPRARRCTAKNACAPVSQAVESSGGAPSGSRFSSIPATTPAISISSGGQAGKGVVLLVGGEGKEEQDEAGKQAQQPGGAHAEFEPEDVAGRIFARGVVQVEIDRLAGVAAQVLHPVCAGSSRPRPPGRARTGSRERARPGAQPVGGRGQPVVVVREARCPGSAESAR